MRFFIFVFLMACCVRAQETGADRHRMATNHLKVVAAEISARCLTNVPSLANWKEQRPELRRQLMEMLGLGSAPARTPMQARITGTLEKEKFRIEKLVFQSLPGLYVTGNFYVPREKSGPLPTIL